MAGQSGPTSPDAKTDLYMRVEEAYAILELDFPSTRDEVKKAFHRLAHVHHPDKGGDAEKFKVINGAYQFLIQRGYWDMLAKEETKRQADHGPADKNPQEAWRGWRPSVMCNDEGTMFWMEDKEGFVTYSWSKEEAIDATSWQDLDDSEVFKDYTKHLKS